MQTLNLQMAQTEREAKKKKRDRKKKKKIIKLEPRKTLSDCVS